ncbi:MAG: hypothetical protein JO116_06030, partial [Planctomycetaceae bacterium]|nr:hypothetical protein [Planctomycetaceae bacterium]
MGLLRSRGTALVLLLSATLAAGQGPDQPAGDREPLFHLETGGPTSLVTALAFSTDGGTLYEAGWDKVVRVWRRQGPQGNFALDAAATYRVPIGPGVDGAINAMALSSDGAWLAVAGNGVVRNRPGFRQLGLMIPAPAQDDEMRRDRGLIYVFCTRGEPRNVRVLRGHLGPVLALAFAPSPDGKPPLLVSAAREREDQGAVRLWDVDRSQPLAHEALPNPTTRPGLAAWYPGPGRERLRVAIAWGDDKLRLWDVDPGPAPRLTTVPDGLYNTTVAPFPSSPTLLTGSLHGRLGQAQLRSWDTDTAVAAPPPFVMLPRPGDQIEVPSAIALVPGAPAQVAIILRRAPDRRKVPNGRTEDLLQLIDVRGIPRAPLSLWKIAGSMPPRPVLAVDPGGRHLAVAGHPDHAIRLFALPDLLQGRAVPQRLQGAGVVLRQVAFVKKGPDWGLWLSDTARDHAPAPGEPPARAWIFDPTRRLLTRDRAGWSLSAPDPTGWSAEVVPAGRDDRGQPVPWSVSVRQGQGPERRIRLRPRQVINACALLPPRPPRAGPIVAIAYQEAEDLGGEPRLGLFDGRTGEQVRQLTGHAERIQGLAFSEDGRLLVSTAEDQTACVWSLADLDDTLGKRGTLAGVTVTEAGGGLVVGRVETGGPAPADADLREGDGIQGRVVEGKLRPVTSMTEFYREVARVKPGQQVTIRRIRKG